jgi:hypothetical protein
MEADRTIPRKIRLYPHEWAEMDRMLRKINKGRKKLIGANRLFSYLFDSDVGLDPLDIEAHTEEARNKDRKRR